VKDKLGPGVKAEGPNEHGALRLRVGDAVAVVGHGQQFRVLLAPVKVGDTPVREVDLGAAF